MWYSTLLYSLSLKVLYSTLDPQLCTGASTSDVSHLFIIKSSWVYRLHDTLIYVLNMLLNKSWGTFNTRHSSQQVGIHFPVIPNRSTFRISPRIQHAWRRDTILCSSWLWLPQENWDRPFRGSWQDPFTFGCNPPESPNIPTRFWFNRDYIPFSIESGTTVIVQSGTTAVTPAISTSGSKVCVKHPSNLGDTLIVLKLVVAWSGERHWHEVPDFPSKCV